VVFLVFVFYILFADLDVCGTTFIAGLLIKKMVHINEKKNKTNKQSNKQKDESWDNVPFFLLVNQQ
jgi:hypothetical protein